MAEFGAFPLEERGLSEAEAASRLAREGPNELPGERHRSLLRILAEVLREPMFALLLAAVGVYLALGNLKEAILLGLFATTSVSIALIQEARSERVLETLKDLSSPRALVIRAGSERRIPGREVVRGDILVLGEGDRVPADATLLSAHDLETDESLLTGESFPVRKSAEEAFAPSAEKGGQESNRAFAGSLVVRGHGIGRVTATGAKSAIGKIGLALATIEREPPRLRGETRRLVAQMATAGFILSALATILYGIWRDGWLQAILNGIALGMSMLPEEFPLVLSVFMVMGAWRIARAHVLTRRVAAIETLGAATVLCTDKTGTLTQNLLTIAEIRAGGGLWREGASENLPEPFARVVQYGALASAETSFDPMERAFHAFLASPPKESEARNEQRRLKWEYPLRAELLAVTLVWEDPQSERLIAATKGAPEAIAGLCRLAEPERQSLETEVKAMAGAGMRVLAVAGASPPRESEQPLSPRAFAFEFLGLVGLADPLRPSVAAAVAECRAAGIKVLMITGDHLLTALKIAEGAGLDTREASTGSDLAQMSDAELRERVRRGTVFARIMPEEKLRIVEALKANGETVAMTGDGVNDAPSLKAAHIGIAMGGRGSDVAREAASLVLLDDDFGSIVAAVRLGRRIYDNLKKSMAYILAVHVPIAGLALFPLLFGLPLIFAPVHIAFLEMVIDPVCSIVFEAEEAEAIVMRRPPRDPKAPLFTLSMVLWSLFQGVLVLALIAAVFIVALKYGVPEKDARALAFTTLIVTNAGLVLVNLSSRLSLFATSNRVLWWVLGSTTAILAAVLSFAPARDLFAFGPLHGHDLVIVAACGLGVLALLQSSKRLFPGVG